MSRASTEIAPDPIGVDTDSGEIVAVAVTRKDIDDAAMAGALLDQIVDPIASFTADGG
jgi:hypothetical protein